MNRPFLTIFTRCCDRPKALARNIESVRAQSCRDIEQIFAIDRERAGMVEANKMFWRYRSVPQGDYVFHLDDDGHLHNVDFVREIKHCAEQSDYPDVILCRHIQDKPKWRPLPPDEIWNLDWDGGERPMRWIGSGYCFVVKTEVWRPNTINYFPKSNERWITGGDWHFMTALIELGVTVAKADTIGAIDHRSGGKFEQTRDGWFEWIAKQYGFHAIKRELWTKKY